MLSSEKSAKINKKFNFRQTSAKIYAIILPKLPEGSEHMSPLHTPTIPNAAVQPHILAVLNRIAMPANMKGYHYVAYAAELCLREPDLLKSTSASLYPAIAREFDTTPQSVERLVRYVIELTFETGYLDELYRLFGDCVDEEKGKVTNKAFIRRVTEVVRERMGDD